MTPMPHLFLLTFDDRCELSVPPFNPSNFLSLFFMVFLPGFHIGFSVSGSVCLYKNRGEIHSVMLIVFIHYQQDEEKDEYVLDPDFYPRPENHGCIVSGIKNIARQFHQEVIAMIKSDPCVPIPSLYYELWSSYSKRFENKHDKLMSLENDKWLVDRFSKAFLLQGFKVIEYNGHFSNR